MAYTTKVLSGRTYWYKDGKRIAVAKVPANVKSGKKSKPNGSKPKPNGSKPNERKVPSMAQIQKSCNNASKAEIIGALNTLSKDELCKLVDQIPKTPQPVKENIKVKAARYLETLEREEHPDGYSACSGLRYTPKCYGKYCSKNREWKCPRVDPEVLNYAAYIRRVSRDIPG